MADDRRWTIYVCPGCHEAVTQRQDIFCDCPMGAGVEPLSAVEVMPVSPVVPLATLREWIETTRWPHKHLSDYEQGQTDARYALADFLDEFERTINHNEGEKP